MTRTVIRHTLSAVAALALVSAFAGSPALAEVRHNSDAAKTFTEIMNVKDKSAAKPKGLATKKDQPLARYPLDRGKNFSIWNNSSW